MINLWEQRTKYNHYDNIDDLHKAIDMYFSRCYGTKAKLEMIPNISGLCKYLGFSGKEEFKSLANIDEHYAKLIGQVLLTLEDVMVQELISNKVTNAKYILDSLGFDNNSITDTELNLDL